MENCIIQLSDLHIVNQYDDNGKLKEESWVNLKPEYLDVLIKKIKKILAEKDCQLLSLIISGDLANSSEIEEYNSVKKFLEKFSFFKIPEEKILIIPGNHDINWDLNKLAFKKFRTNMEKKEQDWKATKPYTFNSEKFQNFTDFYNSYFKTKKFNPDLAIVDVIPFNELKLLLIGVNSIFHESYMEDHYGWIDSAKLKDELNILDVKYHDYNKIAVIHHNIASFNNEQRLLKNWAEIQHTFLEHNIHTFFFGHEHTSGSKSEIYGEFEINYCEVGSLAKHSVTCYFNMYIVEDTKSELSLNRESYHFTPSEDAIHSNTGFWSLNDDEFKKVFNFYKAPKTQIKNSQPIVSQRSKKKIIPQDFFKPTKEVFKYSMDLFEIIKSNKSFKTGHFHWTEDSRTLNWLDTSIIYKKNSYLNLAKASLIELINSNKLDFDIAIGLGIEGNLLTSPISYYFDKKYTYLPYIYRDPDHLLSEKKLLYNNGIKKVLIVDQIVHKATSIQKLLKSEQDFFMNIEKIFLLSLFYTGKEIYHPKIFQTDIDEKIEFYSVCNEFKILDCPKWEKLETTEDKECPEETQKLNEVITFYSKVKKNENL